MRITTIVLLIMLFLVGCENPGESTDGQSLYLGQIVQTESAPFLLNTNSLAKASAGILIFEESVEEGTVYGLQADITVYGAKGGEVLPVGTWVDNQDSEPIEVNLTSGLIITFEKVTTVTLIDAVNVIYVDSAGQAILFSGTGIITSSEISTGSDGSVLLISSTKFGIGGEGGEWG